MNVFAWLWIQIQFCFRYDIWLPIKGRFMIWRADRLHLRALRDAEVAIELTESFDDKLSWSLRKQAHRRCWPEDWNDYADEVVEKIRGLRAKLHGKPRGRRQKPKSGSAFSGIVPRSGASKMPEIEMLPRPRVLPYITSEPDHRAVYWRWPLLRHLTVAEWIAQLRERLAARGKR